MILRDYQLAAVEKMVQTRYYSTNDICVLATGAGKSIIIANFAQRLQCNILILQPSKEILEQNYNKLAYYVDKKDIGIYSASLVKKEVKQYTFATIQSIYKKPELFTDFSIIIIDECHQLAPKNLNGMFMKFIRALNKLRGKGNVKIYGLTATPFRLDTTFKKEGYKFRAMTSIKLINRTKPLFWHKIIFNISTNYLVENGYLAKLVYLNSGIIDQETLPLNKSKTEYDLFGVEKIMSKKSNKIVDTINSISTKVNHILVFCTSIAQANELQQVVPNSKVVTGSTESKLRDSIISEFKNGNIKVVFNVGVLTTGFDFPDLDCIVLARPTQSLSLYSQMLGRGLRLSENKKSCCIVDIVGIVKKLGKVESIKVKKFSDGWDVVTETGRWHNKLLYTYEIPQKQEELF